MTKSINLSTFKKIGALLILSALMVALLIPASVGAAEGKKGLNAVNVKTSDFHAWFETCSREHDKRTVVVCIQEALSAAVIPMFQDQSERRGNTGGGTFTLIKRAGEAPEIDIEIEIPESKGTVKFFNESKSVGGGVADIVIRANGIPTGHRGHSR